MSTNQTWVFNEEQLQKALVNHYSDNPSAARSERMREVIEFLKSDAAKKIRVQPAPEVAHA